MDPLFLEGLQGRLLAAHSHHNGVLGTQLLPATTTKGRTMATITASSQLLTHEQLAERWQVSPRTLHRMEDVPRVKLGRSLRYRLADIEAYEAEHSGTKWEVRR